MISNRNRGSGPVKILQISDTHIFADRAARLLGVDTRWTLDKVVESVGNAASGHDCLVVTGDLSQDESKESYVYLADELKKLNLPVYCVPGNHDLPDMMNLMLKELGQGLLERRFVIGNWQLVLLNTTDQRIGGHLSSEELVWLDNCLSEFPEHDALIAMHHHPVPVGSKWADRIGLDNADSFFSILESHGKVRGVICGHVHQSYETKHNGVRIMSCPSTCVQFKPGSDSFALDTAMPGYRWLTLKSDGSIETGVERIDFIDIGADLKAKGY